MWALTSPGSQYATAGGVTATAELNPPMPFGGAVTANRAKLKWLKSSMFLPYRGTVVHALVILERASKEPLLAGEKGDVGEQGFPTQLWSLMSFAEAHLDD